VVWVPSSPLAAIRAHAPKAVVSFDPGTDAAKAAALAASAHVAIVFVRRWTSEGMDMPDLRFADQDAMVAAVAAANPHTVVVLENGSAQVMPWLDKVNAVLEAWFPGQRGGEAIANLLFGNVNPSGKLPLTFPAAVSDLPRPTIAGNDNAVFPLEYSEGLKTGYKWFDANQISPLFPFGFGLSYTTFTIGNAQVVSRMSSSRPGFDVKFDLRNTGSVAGAEVAQVYLALPPSTAEPPKRLVGWQKVLLSPGALQHVAIAIDEDDAAHPLSCWDTAANRWITAPGLYTVYLGNSSANLSVAGTFSVGQ
jgi:beta-glucosidase